MFSWKIRRKCSFRFVIALETLWMTVHAAKQKDQINRHQKPGRRFLWYKISKQLELAEYLKAEVDLPRYDVESCLSNSFKSSVTVSFLLRRKSNWRKSSSSYSFKGYENLSLRNRIFSNIVYNDWRSLFFRLTVCCAVVRLFQVISKRMTMKNPSTRLKP